MHTETAPTTPARTTNQRPDLRPLCTHQLHTDRTCGSPALRGEIFCYFHHPTRKEVRNSNERQARRIARQSFPMALPTNRHQFQQTLGQIVQRLAANQLDPRRAGLLLFALQIVHKDLEAG